jgi:hypothetical protein
MTLTEKEHAALDFVALVGAYFNWRRWPNDYEQTTEADVYEAKEKLLHRLLDMPEPTPEQTRWP